MIFINHFLNFIVKEASLTINDSQMTTLNNELKGFASSFFINEGSIRRIAESNLRNFVFHDEKNPGIYVQSEFQIKLVTLPVFRGD